MPERLSGRIGLLWGPFEATGWGHFILQRLILMLSELLLTEMSRLTKRDDMPLHRQLYEALRRAMLDGKLGAGERLPSSRELTTDLKLSRNTVVSALNQLSVEGYLVSRVGSGTYVNDNLPKPQARKRQTHVVAHTADLSKRGTALSTTFCSSQLEMQPFTPGIADFSAFPVALWQRLQNKHWRMTYPEMLDYSHSGGYAPLRRAVADYLRVFRSVPLDVDQVIITSGTQQSLELCSQLLADHGDTVWMEDPAYWGAANVFIATGLQAHPVAVDQEGMAPCEQDEFAPPRLIYTTPSHQYPTGAVMSLVRRQQILSIARTHKAWILEDDYDSEFRPLKSSSLPKAEPDGQAAKLCVTTASLLRPIAAKHANHPLNYKLQYSYLPPAIVRMLSRHVRRPDNESLVFFRNSFQSYF